MPVSMRVFILALIFFAFTPTPVMTIEEAISSMFTPAPKEGTRPAMEKDESAAQIYICPMHPHIHGKKGERCPICGMDLVPASVQEPPSESVGKPVEKPVEKKDRKVLYWYDPMEPGQKFDKPGKSPYMDMDLVPFYEEEARSGQGAPGNALYIEPGYRQALGVRTAQASRHEFGRAIHAFGHIEPSTRLEHTVAVRTSGWIVDLNTDAVGDTVKKGDLLFTFYSPDLMTAQSDYLIGSRVGNSEQRLRLHGMDDRAIADLKRKGKFLEATPFYAPADGTVSMLNVRKGAYIGEGGAVLSLQDYSQVWIQTHVPVRDMQFLTVGSPAVVTIDETGESFKTAVDFIYPVTDPQSRNGLARLVLENPDGRIKIDSLVRVVFESDSQSRLAVPAESVLYAKDGGHVIADLGDGYFRAVKVATGLTADGMTEISSGLKEGERIVTSGQFMIDAESSLSGGMAGMADSGEGEEESAHKH